ncbi:MAG TPA: hypothetical protein PK402_07590 [Tepidisphaeraceae bacterium]|nr:hypothetical protein [Tepidisphaeraceae bacterium]
MSASNSDSTVRVALVGHCTPDSSYLTITVQKAITGAKVVRVHDDAGVEQAIAGGALLLVNRRMEPGYADTDGNEYIRRLIKKHPGVRLMLISNLVDSQAQAVSDGALSGFGKDHLNQPGTLDRLRDAVRAPIAK